VIQSTSDKVKPTNLPIQKKYFEDELAMYQMDELSMSQSETPPCQKFN